MLATSATMKIRNRPLLPPDRRHTMTGKILRKGNLLEAAVILERDIKVREEITLLEIARIRHVIIGILNENRDATSVEKWVTMHREVDSA